MHWKWILPIIAAGVAVAAWSTFAVGLALDFGKPTMIVIATVGAFALEGIVWTLAAALGVTVFEARRTIWKRLTGGLGQRG